MRVRSLFLTACVALAACDPETPVELAPIDAAGPDAAAPPPPPPGTAMETPVAAGRMRSKTMVLDVQLGGGTPAPAASPNHRLRPGSTLR